MNPIWELIRNSILRRKSISMTESSTTTTPAAAAEPLPESFATVVPHESILTRISRTLNGRRAEWPDSFNAAIVGEGAYQAKVFDPALAHFPRGFRPGNPSFGDPEIGKNWYSTRYRAMLHLLNLIGTSTLAENLVLRGSVVMQAWFGDDARVPGDMDWIVTPSTVSVTATLANELFVGVIDLISQSQANGNIRFSAKDIAIDEIWAYDRAPGKRFVVPWQAENLPPGSVQVDFVFNESLRFPTIETAFPTHDGGSVEITTASPEEALAWKLQWLLEDSCPQGKDLYDATLLAERTVIPMALLHESYRRAGMNPQETFESQFLSNNNIDWDNFQAEYPWITGNANDWISRLCIALTRCTQVET